MFVIKYIQRFQDKSFFFTLKIFCTYLFQKDFQFQHAESDYSPLALEMWFQHSSRQHCKLFIPHSIQ